MKSAEQLVFAAMLVCLAGAGISAGLSRWRRAAGWFALGVTSVSAGLILTAVARVLQAGPGEVATLMPVPALGFALRLYVDGLSAIFLGLAAVIAVPAALYSIAYLDHYQDERVGRYYGCFLVFLAAMYGLVCTTDMMWFFFIFWQMMTLPGYALIRYERGNRANIRAATKYLVMMQIACGLTMVGAEILATAQISNPEAATEALKYDFDSVARRLPELLAQRGGLVATAFTLFLIGFGIKMGMWPFGAVWLPDAHPAAPSPISAMLSGVMIKTGVYGLMRYFLWLVPEGAREHYPSAKWGLVIAGLGTLTLFAGTLQALRQEQTKRLLAFHSIGQIGYILLGVGASLALLGSPAPNAARASAVAIFASLFHVVNHGTFKALLFLNAGSILFRTGTQDLNRLGGLLRYMPITGATALVASLAISGVPPLNGFASKWSLYVSTISGSDTVGFLAVCALVAILTSALTLASFVKFFGTSFLSRTSERVTEVSQGRRSLEVVGLMQAPQLFLAALCLLLGLWPSLAYQTVRSALAASRQGLGVPLSDALPAGWNVFGGVGGLPGQGVLAPLVILTLIALLMGFAVALASLGGAQRRAVAPWNCGYARESSEQRYRAHSFYGELKRWFHHERRGSSPPAKPPGTLTVK